VDDIVAAGNEDADHGWAKLDCAHRHASTRHFRPHRHFPTFGISAFHNRTSDPAASGPPNFFALPGSDLNAISAHGMAIAKADPPENAPPRFPAPNPPTRMKTQLLSLLLFAAPLMLQVLMSEAPALAERSPAGAEAPAKDNPSADHSPSKSEVKTDSKNDPAKAPPPAAAPAKPGRRIPAKLAPWLM
jgi:hypothetical protein